MAVSSFLSPRYLIGAVVVVVLFTVFNMTRAPLETETQAQFQKWYGSASTYLLAEGAASAHPRAIMATIKLVPNVSAPAATNEWHLASGSAGESEKRLRLARVLELVKESGVYGNSSYLLSAPPTVPHLFISANEDDKNFKAYLPLSDLENNIQLKNLLKLLEVFSVTPPTVVPSINPTQL